jgi:pyruvate kinase
MLSSLRPAARILAATPSARVAAQLALTWGVVPLVTPAPSIADVRGALHMARLVTDGDIVVFVSMHPKLGPDGRNYIHVERV